ncbi:hypothetical protein PILCRDRAFT_815139 [Piloderma croceum F 1598]|uniref:Major facilitator superfamily (MFS) profile domain-containing protein n=1 Tax=Piloderma croceum (strain F 1598) TaxID=765440 RepID=A0A0C3BM82_PILCF|nr:hypothetical protein PILCRDRAFT_815139 [Piloderma croceum F 1598]
MSCANSDETRLLLSDDNLETQRAVKAKGTPLPLVQLGVLCSVRITEPIAFTQIFPYINNFISSLHVTDDPKRIGFYSGLVESVFAIFQLLSIYNLAKLSDKVGRRPVILFGITGIAVTTVLFGLSKSLPMMLIARALAGLCSGNTAVIHAVVGELTDASNQAVALPLYGLVWPLGSIIGPLLGGTFSHPASKFQFLDWAFLRNYPYFLPCFISGVLGILGVVFGFFYLEETLPSKRSVKVEKPQFLSRAASASSTLYGTMEPSELSRKLSEPHSFTSLLSKSVIRALCGSGFALNFLAGGFEVVFVLYCYSAIEDGGLGLPTEQIGYSLSGSGILAMLLQILLMPYLMRTFDKAKVYNFCMCLFPFMFIVLSMLNLIARRGYDEVTGVMNSHTTGLLWAGIALVLSMSRVVNLSFALSMMLAKEYSPNEASLGVTNALVQFSMCLSRAVSPAFVSSIFALSIDHNLLGGYLWVVIMVMVSLGGIYQSATIANASESRF